LTSGSKPQIDRDYYDKSGYFETGAGHLLDSNSRFQQYRRREVLALCGDVSGARAVDLGCGWGTISFALAENAREVIGVDFAETSVRICRSRHDVARLPGLSFIQADARSTGLPGGAWDLVVAADLVEHLSPRDTIQVYAEALRLLRPGGRFVIWTPNPTHVLEALRRWGVLRADPTHIDYKALDRVVRELESVGFGIVRAGWVPSHLPLLRIAERFAQQWLPLLRRRVAVVAEAPSSVLRGARNST
jgi:2-polyprenyl-3-methyl-5-hydroxy-6-metoxy-1,4-benzoquinol methylase